MTAGDAARYRRIQEILDGALDCAPEDREAYLAEACGDDEELRAEVVTLLATHERTGPPDRLDEGTVAETDSSEEDVPPPRIAHYRLLEKLGGGQSVVYRAYDERLDRTVALKLLPTRMGTDAGAKERFIIEARAAASLEHTNICTIHEIGETEPGPGDDGRLYIVMPFYRGETLKQRIARGGPLPVPEALDIAAQVATGLARSHAGGIAHRDIKPANIHVTEEGVVKILDFGITKLADVTLTATGTTLGTVAYMSPEQARGADIDHRSDIWSLGVVLYEMLAGERPYRGGHEMVVLHSILESEHVPIAEARPDLRPGVAGVVERALSKDPELRQQSAGELEEELNGLLGRSAASSSAGRAAGPRGSRTPGPTPRRWIAAAALGMLAIAAAGTLWLQRAEDPLPQSSVEARPNTPPSGLEPRVRRLAVLPFANLQSDPESDYLGYAIADQVIGSLSNFGGVFVRPSSAVRQFAGSIEDPTTIGGDLDVEFVLTGAFLKIDDEVRLTVELVDVTTNELIWRDDLQVAFESAFVLQDQVATSVVDGLSVQFSDAEQARLGVDVPANPLAYEYYLRARAQQATEAENRIGLELADRSIALDSTYAPAWLERGSRQFRMGQLYFENEEENVRLDEESFQRALALNPDLLEGLERLSALYTLTGRVEQALQVARRMVTLNPNSPLAHLALSVAYRYGGMNEESRFTGERGLAVDPGNRQLRFHAAVTYYHLGDYQRSRDAMDFEESGSALWWIGWNDYLLGDEERALESLRRVFEYDTDGFFGLAAQVSIAIIEGDTIAGLEAARIRDTVVQHDGETFYFDAVDLGLLGDVDGGVRNLGLAVERGFFNYPAIRSDPWLDPLREAPGFNDVMEAARTRHEAFVELASEEG